MKPAHSFIASKVHTELCEAQTHLHHAAYSARILLDDGVGDRDSVRQAERVAERFARILTRVRVELQEAIEARP